MRTDERAIYIVGAGGHAKVVMDAMLSAGQDARALVFVDDSPVLRGSRIMSVPIDGPVSQCVKAGDLFHVAIGDPGPRTRLHLLLCEAGATSFRVVHPRASVSAAANLGQGVFIAAGAVVAPMATLGDAVIVNHGAVVDHDVVVGGSCHIAPNATLGGGVWIGRMVLVGAAATVLPGVRIGDGATIGAGAVVTRDVPEHTTVKGVPARKSDEVSN